MAEYGTLTALKDRIGTNVTQHDTVLSSLIVSASQKIDRYCNRPDGFISLATAIARTFPGSGTGIRPCLPACR